MKTSNTPSAIRRLCLASTLLAAIASLTAAPVIYEPFTDSEATLTGNTPGTGLTGTWTTAGLSWAVTSGSLAFGTLLPTSGNTAASVSAGARGSHSITTGTTSSNTLKNAGLLNDGATVWFSFLWKTDDASVSNQEAAFAFGTDRLVGGGANAFMPLETTNGGNGIGISFITSASLNAATWSGGSRSTGSSATLSSPTTPKLVVGRIVWGSTATQPDFLYVYLPGTDLVLPVSVSSTSAVLNQSLFNTITFGSKAEGDPKVDEIRFGATYLDVIGAAPTAAYWDTDDTTAGSGSDDTPDGTWNTDNLWNPVADGTGTTAAWTANQAAVFAAGTDATGAYGVAVDSTQSIGGLTFEEGTVTLSGGTALELPATGGAIDVRLPAAIATVSTPITQPSLGGNLYKDGSGTLVLSGINTYDCPTVVATGKLILSGDNSGSTGAMTLAGGITQFDSTLAIPGSGRSVTVGSGAVAMFGSDLATADITTGLGRIATASAGVIAADNNDADNFDLSAFTAAYFGAVGTVDYTGTITPNLLAYRLGGGGGSLTITGTNKINNTGGNRTLTVQGPGTVTLANSNNYSGNTTINSGGTLILSSSNSATNVTINVGGKLVVGNANSVGAGTINPSGALVIASSSTFGSGKIFFSTGAKISSDSTTARSFNAVVQGNANNTIILGDAVNNGKLTATGNWMMSSSGTTYQVDSEIELSGSFQSSGNAFTKTGAGTMIISGTNPLHTGPKTISAGTLSLTGSLTGGEIATNTTGVLSQSSTGVISGTASILQSSNQTSTLAGTNTYTGTTRITAGTLLVNSLASGGSDSSIGKSNASAAKLVLGGGTLKYAPISAVGGAGATIDRNFSIIGNSTLDASGTGALVFNAPVGDIISPDVTGLGGSWTTTTTVTGLSSTADLAVGMRVSGTGIAAGTTIASITSGTAITLSTAPTAGSGASFGYTARTLTLTGTNTDANTIAGNLQNSSAAGAQNLSLTKTGIGTWVLSGANTYSGATAVNGGKLLVTTGSGTRCASAITVANTAGCIFGVQLAAANGQWASSSSLTVAGANSQIEVDYNSTTPSTSTSEDPIKVTNLTVSGVGTLKVLGVTPGTPNGTYPLINFTGTGPAAADPYTGLTLSLPLGVSGKLTTTANHVNLVIEGGTTYTVTYDGNGGTGTAPTDTNTYATGASVTLANSGSLVKTGFVFTGWNTQADGLGTHYNAGASYTMGSANVTFYADWKTPYNAWAATYLPADVSNPAGNNDGDLHTNLQEFGFAFNPTVSDGSGPLTISGGVITQNGPPQIYEDPVTHQFFLRYTRRTDHGSAGLTYTAQFAADSLGAGSFEDVAGGSVIATGTGAGGVPIQAVAIEFPDALPVSGKKARFGRVEVTQTP